MPRWVPQPRDILANVAGNIIVAGVVAVVVALWAFRTSREAPYMVVAGILVFAAVLWILRQFQERLPETRHTGGVTTTPLPDDLVRFVNAWFMPTCDEALSIMLRIREEIRQSEGERIEALFQLAVDKVAGSHKALQDRLQGKGEQFADALAADAYRAYEFMVSWFWRGGENIDMSLLVSSQQFEEWRMADEKMLGHLRELVASPSLTVPLLSEAFRAIEDGGAAKQVRRNLSGIAVLSVRPEAHGGWARLQLMNAGNTTIQQLQADAHIISGATISGESRYPIHWRGRTAASVNLPAGRPDTLDVAEVAGFREFKFHTAAMSIGDGEMSESFVRKQMDDEGFVLQVLFTAEAGLGRPRPRYYQLRMDGGDPRAKLPGLPVRPQDIASQSVLFRELSEDEASALAPPYPTTPDARSAAIAPAS